MKAKQFEAALKKLGLNHSNAARVLGIGRSSVLRYAGGYKRVPESLKRFIAMLERHGIPEEFTR